MANIYLSSTFSDLEEYRRRLSTAVRSMGHVDVAMEYYAAGPRRPLERCLDDVARCDLYVGIFAFRYGYIPPGHDRSITELEYRKAREAGKDCIILLLKDGASWPTDRIEFGAYEKVRALRKELSEENTVGFFTNKDDLYAAFTAALLNWEKSRGLKRATEVTDWDAYRRAFFEEHRWVRLAVIAGAKQDRIAHVPLTEVFVPQMATAGRPIYEVPEEVLESRRHLFSQARPPSDAVGEEEPATGAESGEAVEEADALAGEFSEPVLDLFARERTQVVLGGPGSGKSTLLLYAMLALCDPERSDRVLPPHLQAHTVPFMIELRQYVLKGMPDFVDYIVGHVRANYGAGVEAEGVRGLLGEEGRALVFFDGLDEVFDPAEREKAIRMFRAFAREFPRTRIVVTSRIVGYDDKDLGVAMFKHYTLLDFGVGQVRQFVRRWYEYYTWEGDTRDSEGLIQRIAESPRLLELAGNPLLLTMMSVVYKHQDLPEQRWLLYQRCTEVLLEDWDIKRKSIDQSTLLPLDINIKGAQKAEILQRVSMYMLEHGQPGRELNAIAYEPLLRLLADYLEQKYAKPRGDAEVLAEEILNHLRERTYILAEVGERVFGFVHRTFMEYFAASYLKSEFNARKADYGWLTEEMFGGRWHRDEWQEVLLLLIAMLAGQGSPVVEIIEFLRRQTTQPPFNLAFAARCLAEAGPVADGKLARRLVETLVREVVTRASQIKKKDATAFVEAALSAISVLAPMTTASETAKKAISALEARKSLQERIVAWQLGLALRSREERLDYALAALLAREEAVSRGAIAALEREWPGKLEVGQALVEVVRSDTHSRVRQTALKALQRAWPDSPAVLDAVESIVDEVTAYTDAVWMIDYLAANWRGHRKALSLILKLAGTKPKANYEYSYPATQLAASRAIVKGWADDSTALPFLQSQLSNDDFRIRVAALEAIVMGRPKDHATSSLLKNLIVNGPTEDVRLSAVSGLADGWAGQADTLLFLQEQAVINPIAAVRALCLKLITGYEYWPGSVYELFMGSPSTWEVYFNFPFHPTRIPSWLKHPSNLPLLHDRVANDSAEGVRLMALAILAVEWRDDPQTRPLLFSRAVDDSSAEVRLTALNSLAGAWPGDTEVISFLRELGMDDPDERIRYEVRKLLNRISR